MTPRPNIDEIFMQLLLKVLPVLRVLLVGFITLVPRPRYKLSDMVLLPVFVSLHFFPSNLVLAVE